MVAIDTNVLVRLVVNDDPEQTEKALTRLEGQRVYVPVTVVLETEWVLRHCYALSAAKIRNVFRELLANDDVEVAETKAVEQALCLHENGLDFADALHLCLSVGNTEGFLTFDKAFFKAVPTDFVLKADLL
ncbi:MAG: type II toxin-antitoxin system VapC family toxin [Lentisphaeria bacterium]|nr:type II toxin-antitoxin system VapC family toxin [Lentisphaeria bacterium]